MIIVNGLNVYATVSTQFLYLQWSIESTGEDLSEYYFNILRSLSPNENFLLLTTVPATGVYEYRDSALNLDKLNYFYYKIVVVKKKSLLYGEDIQGDNLYNSFIFDVPYGNISSSQTEYIRYRPDYIGNGIVRNEQWALEKVLSAKKMFFLKRRTFGQNCPECYDSFSRKTVKSNCLACFGTGIFGGYCDPEITRVQVNPETFAERIDEQGARTLPSVVNGWMTNLPFASPQDIFIDSQNNRYRTSNVYLSKLQSGFITRQVLTLQRIPRLDIAYNISVPSLDILRE
jgi:hypothetical protein